MYTLVNNVEYNDVNAAISFVKPVSSVTLVWRQEKSVGYVSWMHYSFTPVDPPSATVPEGESAFYSTEGDFIMYNGGVETTKTTLTFTYPVSSLTLTPSTKETSGHNPHVSFVVTDATF